LGLLPARKGVGRPVARGNVVRLALSVGPLSPDQPSFNTPIVLCAAFTRRTCHKKCSRTNQSTSNAIEHVAGAMSTMRPDSPVSLRVTDRPQSPAGIRVSQNLDLQARNVWDLVTDLEAQQQWLGVGSAMVNGLPLELVSSSGPWRLGRVTVLDRASRKLTLSLGGWPGCALPVRTVVQIVVEADQEEPHRKSTITVLESPDVGTVLDSEVARELQVFWQSALSRLRTVAGLVNKRRRVAQAVVIVHGIGEQIPGDTLNGFVDAVVPSSPGDGVMLRSKPDRISQSLELRQLSLSAFGAFPKTDFYEYYWAHEIRDTTAGQVVGWLWRVLRRKRREVPGALRPAWVVGRIAVGLLLTATLSLVISAIRTEGLLVLVGVASAALSLLSAAASAVLVRGLGDASRYLSARPGNVDARERIRLRGIELLERLHASRRYSRIVIVGHSLGSVIAYDIVTHLWTRMHRDHLRPSQVKFGHSGTLHRYQGNDAAAAQSMQHDAWKESRRNTQPWLITDLITVGSPLAHADLLMTRSKAEWQKMKRRRQLPTAPPVRDEKADEGVAAFWFQDRYTNRGGDTHRTFRYWHHAAPFALVRWTNLYFPARLGFLGDPIGGPIRPLFGDWILEHRLEPPRDWPWIKRCWVHSSYWKASTRDGSASPATPLDLMRSAIRLTSEEALRLENSSHSPLMYLEQPEF